MNDREAAIVIEEALDTLTEVGNGVTDEHLYEARAMLFRFRDEWLACVRSRHEDLKARNSFLRNRLDLPVDRMEHHDRLTPLLDRVRAEAEELAEALQGILESYENILVNEWSTMDDPHPEKTDADCIKAHAALKKWKN